MKKLLSFTLWCLLCSSLFAQNVTLQAPIINGDPGDTVSVPIQATNFTDMVSLQFSVGWDTSVVQFVGTNNYNATLGINASLIGTAQSANGFIGVSWDDALIQGVTLPGVITFFDLRLRIVGNPGDTSAVQFGNVPTSIFAAKFAGGTFPTAPVDTVSGSVIINQAVNCANYTSFSNLQNPTCGQNNGGITVVTNGGTAPESYAWSDGDTTNPRSNLAPGLYTVTVTDANGCTTSTGGTLINQGLPPTANFSVNSNNLIAAFTDLSTDGPTAWAWDFGDGSTSTLQNPTHTYLAAGTYTACLIASNACGSDTLCEVLTVTAPPSNLTVFSQHYTGDPGDTVTVPVRALSFTDMITLQFSVNWDTSVVEFVNVQDFDPTMGLTTVTNFGLTQTMDGRLGFSWDDVTISGVTIADTVDMFNIRFVITGMPGDSTPVAFGGVPTSISASRFAGGTFPTAAVDTIPGSVVVNAVNCANFSATAAKQDPTCGLANGNITIAPVGGTAPFSYLWTDADTTNPRLNIGPGTYTVTVTDANGCTATASETLVNTGGLVPFANFSFPLPATNPVTFTDNSTNVPTAWAWSFGDGNTSTVQSPTHTYATAGTYTIQLIASNSCGADTAQLTFGFPAPPANTITIFSEHYRGDPGDTVIVPVRALSFTDMITLQFSMNWDTSVVDFVDVQDFDPTMNLSTVTNFGLTQTMDGRLGFSWDDVTIMGVTIPDTVDMFSIRFVITGMPGDSTPVAFGGVPTSISASRFAGGTFPTAAVDTIPGSVVVNAVNCANFSATATKQDPTCGLANGNITIATVGGTAPFSYLWTDNDTTNPRLGIGPGTYTVTVTDANGCTATASETLVNTGGLPPVAGYSFADTNLVITFTDTSTNVPTNWLWDFGDGNTSTAQNPVHTYASVGTYTVCLTVTNSCGTDSVCLFITAKAPVNCANFVASATVVDPTCGLSNGSITITSVGGTPPISVLYGDSDTTNPRTGLGPAIFNKIIVRDVNQCIDTVAATLVNQGLPPVASFSSADTGLVVTFTDTSANVPTNWLWDFGDGNTSTLQNPIHTYAAAGSYTVCLTVTNVCGTDSSCQTVTVAPAVNCANFDVTATATDPTCGLSNGSVSFTFVGGTAPVSYLWSDGDTTNPRLNMAAGSYSVIATDANGCMDTLSGTLVNQGGLPPIAAFGANTSALTASFLNFTINAPTSFAWDFGDGNSSTAPIPTHTYAANGTYTVSLIATNACGSDTFTNAVTVFDPCLTFAGFASIVDPSCGQNNGSITILTFGGTAPLTYQWLDGDSINPRTGLAPGTYSVVVTDSNNCTTTIVDSLTNQGLAPVAAFASSKAAFTFNFTDQSANSPATWTWDFGDGNTSFAQNPTHTYVNAGFYTVCLIVTNTCGSDTICQTVDASCTPGWTPIMTGNSHNIIIPANATLLANGQPVPNGYYLGVFHTDQNGMLQPAGFIIWNGTATSMTVFGDDATTPLVKEGFVPGETFTWKVYQPCGCELDADSVSYAPTGGLVTHTNQYAINGLSQLTSLSFSQFSANVVSTNACFGNPVNGTAMVTPVNGCAPYQIIWDTPNQDTTFSLTGLTPGFKRFTIIDSCGCILEDSVDIMLGPPPVVGISASPSDTFCVGDTVTLTAVGGAFSNYLWTGPPSTPNVNSDQIQVTEAGFYSVFAIDSCGATATAFIILVEKPLPTPTITASPDTIFCFGDSVILDATGNYTAYRWFEAGNAMVLDTTATYVVSTPGTYVVEVDSNGCTGRDTISISQYPIPLVSVSASPDTAFCPGDFVTITATPGFVSYLWNTLDTTQSITTGVAGTYTVTVTDINGCMATADITLTQYPQPVVDIIAAPDTNFCVGDSVILLADPATFIAYSWSNGDTLASTVVNQPGLYTVTAVDINGCVANDSIRIDTFPQPTVDIVGDTAFCAGDSVLLSTVPNTFVDYQWSTGSAAPSIFVNATGTYSVIVTDANGCMTSDSFFVQQNPLPIVNITSSGGGVFCSGLTDTLDAGSGFVAYDWSTGDTTQSIVITMGGQYIVTVTDSNGCQASDTLTVQMNISPTPTVKVDPSTGFCLADTVSLGVNENFVSYLWSTGDTNQVISVTAPIQYTVTVTDTNGCVGMAMVDLSVQPVDTQDIFIRRGWNIISSYICVDEKLMDSIFLPIDTAIWIVKDETGQAFIPNMVNTIGDWDVRKGYQVKAYQDTTLRMVGQKVDHTQVELLLPTGWSLISYLRDSALAVAPALGTDIVNDLYLLKNQDGLAFIPSFFIDQIGDLEPGQGYWVKMITSDTLIYPARTGNFENWYVQPLTARHFRRPANTGENATLILPLDGMFDRLEIGDEVGIRSESGVMAGTAVYDGLNMAIAIWGDDPTTEGLEGMLPGEKFELVRWSDDKSQEEILEAEAFGGELVYRPDAIIIANLKGKPELAGNQINFYPNPANSKLHFDLDLISDQEVTISLYDMMGRKVVSYQEAVVAGGHTMTLNVSQLARATYSFIVEYEGGVKWGKVILE